MYNFIDGDFFESLCDFTFGDMYSSNMVEPNFNLLKNIFSKNTNPIIFIETHRIGNLFKELINFPNNRVKIIAHNSDATFGKEILPYIPNNVDIIWCQNYNYIETDKIKSLPIGLERVRWFPEQRKQEVLKEMVESKIKRDNLCYMNFNPSTNPYRQNIFNILKDESFIDKDMIGNGGNYINYIESLKKYKYIISPPGNGVDCHRNWEAIYLGCVPIVLKSHFTENIYKKLPVLIVDDYSELNENKLNNSYDNLINKSIDSSYIEYWKIKLNK